MKRNITLLLVVLFVLSFASCKKICYCDVKQKSDGAVIYPKQEIGIISKKDCEEFNDPHWDAQDLEYQCYQE